MYTNPTVGLSTISLDKLRLKFFEDHLHDAMMLTDITELTLRIDEAKEFFMLNPGEINKARLGVVYHQAALYLPATFKASTQAWAKQSLDILSDIVHAPHASKELLPIVTSYRASALAALAVSAQRRSLLAEAYQQFSLAVESYAQVSALPEFLRGGSASNLPIFYFRKRKFAQEDFRSIIRKEETSPGYASASILSYSYLALANQRRCQQSKKERVLLLSRSIAQDPDGKAAAKEAAVLKAKLESRK